MNDEGKTQTESVFITEKEVAKKYRRSLQGLRNDRFNRRGLPYYKFGRSVLYKENECDAIIEAQRVETTGF